MTLQVVVISTSWHAKVGMGDRVEGLFMNHTVAIPQCLVSYPIRFTLTPFFI